MEAIEIKQLTKQYSKNKVLDGVSTTIASGQVVGLLGRNGAGKTTLLSILAGLEKPDGGKTITNEIDPEKDPEKLRQKVALVTEECHFYGWMTPETLASTFASMYKSWNNEYYQELLKQFKIDSTKKIANFSKGTKRKLQLAFALATEPGVLLLDEPIGGIDAVAREEILGSLIQSLVDKGVTIVVSSHEINDISGVCDRIIILSEGKFIVDENKDELLSKVRRITVNLENNVETLPSSSSILSAKSDGSELEIVLKDYSQEIVDTVLANFKTKSITTEGVGLQELFTTITANEK